jgi:hypothetical protein
VQEVMQKCVGPLHKGQEVSALFFGKNQKACKSCKAAYDKERYKAKGEAIRANNRKYKTENKEAMAEYNREWCLENKDKKLESNRRFLRKPNNRILKNLKNRVHRWLGVRPTNAQAIELLGCTVTNWMSWLQARFTPGMGWKNYGQGERFWELDHYMPLSKWDKSDPDQIKRALHYTNTRPLWSRDNQSKGSKVPLTPLPLAA